MSQKFYGKLITTIMVQKWLAGTSVKYLQFFKDSRQSLPMTSSSVKYKQKSLTQLNSGCRDP
jgi:hypothetical protein